MTRGTPKKLFGQNFLTDQKVVRDLAAAAQIAPLDIVLEIGAGEGIVTKELAKRAKNVIAIEIDKDLIPTLKRNLRDFKNVEIINQDIMKFKILNFKFKIDKVVGAIPYRITSPLLHKLIIEDPKPKLIVLLIQKEVAKKITAQPPKATYLSNFIETTYKTELLRIVKRGAFKPQPKVDGAIVRLKKYKEIKDLEEFSKFLHKGFSHPRKMLNKVVPVGVLKEVGINPKKRPQEVMLNEWRTLYKK